MFESLIDLITASPWVYPLILAIACLDAIFPLVPSEATMIAAAALAGSGDLVLPFVLLAGAAGAFLGDNLTYLLGRAGRSLVGDRILASRTWRRRLSLAQGQLEHRGGTIIVVSRFIPGGRTATMLAAGMVALRWRRFLCFDLAAAVLWAGYAGLIGWIGGKTFADEPLHALALAFAVAAALALLIEVSRRLRRRRWGHQPIGAHLFARHRGQ